jgi:hypothetical protein
MIIERCGAKWPTVQGAAISSPPAKVHAWEAAKSFYISSGVPPTRRIRLTGGLETAALLSFDDKSPPVDRES